MIDRDLVLAGLAELADSAHQEQAWAGPDSGARDAFAACTRKLFDDSGLSAALGPDWFFGRGRPFRPVVFSRKIDIALRMLRTLAKIIGDRPLGDLLDDPRLQGCRQSATWILEQLRLQPAS